MLSLPGYLKRCLQRRYPLLSVCCLCVALFTFVLEYNYVGKQRDLLYWVQLLRSMLRWLLFTCSLLCTCSLLLVTILQLCVLVMVPARFNGMMKFLLCDMSRKYRRRRFANFIVRRMLCQLELAMSGLPMQLNEQALLEDSQLLQRYQLAKHEAYQAVDLFRRDAASLILPQDVAPSFFVHKEEDQALLQAGYAQIGLKVSHKVLRQLLYPQRGIVT